MDIVIALALFVLGLIIGAATLWASSRGRTQALVQAVRADMQGALEAERTASVERLRRHDEERQTEALAQERRHHDTVSALKVENEGLRRQLEGERANAAEKIALLGQARQDLTDQFRNLANEILEEKSKRFAEQNQQSLGGLLEPLKEKLAEFRGKVEEVYVQEGKDRSALAEQVRQLVSLNQTLSAEARSLTQALKGSNKTQGNWGELILEQLLEASGLQKGQAYVVQDSQVREDGSRAQPDVVIHLPGDRRLVVDAKVSLVSYQRHHEAQTEPERAEALKGHLTSVRAHVKGLSEKNYQALYGLRSLDFVIMFLPVEPAFTLAVTNDEQLFMDAWTRNVLLVSPSTLLFVVRTVAYLWSQENQNRNVQEVARRGAALYDKLVGFVSELKKVDGALTNARTQYDTAFRMLSEGPGNVIRRAEMLKELGVKPTKSLPSTVVDQALADDTLPPPTLAEITGGGAPDGGLPRMSPGGALPS